MLDSRLLEDSGYQGEWKVHGMAIVHASAVLGEGTVLMPYVFVGPNVEIGHGCFVGPGTCIGQPGFGYTTEDDRSHRYRRHNKGVIIGDDVHIGANACIDQGRHRPTRVGRGTRIDNLVHVAHNVEVGEDCLIIACSMLAGSVTIGDRVQVSPCAAVRDWRSVGADSHVGLGAVVVNDIPSGVTVKGVPAR